MSVDAMESTETPAGAATAAIPRHIRELFGEPALLRTEGRDAYDTLWSALVVQFDPREIMEWAWVCGCAPPPMTAPAYLRVLPELIKFSRYEGEALSRRRRGLWIMNRETMLSSGGGPS